MKKEKIVIYLNRSGCPPLWKGQAIVRSTEKGDYPIAYIKKAKGTKDNEYWKILNFLFLSLND